MLKRVIISLAVVLLASPASAAATTDRPTAVNNLAEFYYAADACQLQLSRAKVDAYHDAVAPAGDALFNVDVFRATQALYAAQKDWSKDQISDYCKGAADMAKSLGVLL